jgi:maleate isomerase
MKRTYLGMLTPSSNTTLEPLCSRMLAGLPDVSAHFGRFRVTEISLSDQALGQFDISAQLAAADLLADAKCSTICWNGTSASWLGLDQDRRLCDSIRERTGIPACSSVLALDEVFRLTGVKRFGLVSPYIDEIQSRIIKNFAGHGYACAAERHTGMKVNFDFATITEAEIETMVSEVAAAQPDAITILCTNMRGAALAEPVEAKFAIPIYDSVSLALWASLRIAGIDPSRVRGYGRLFRDLR